MTERKEYKPLDDAILHAILTDIRTFRAIDKAVKDIAKPYRYSTGEHDEWPTAYVVRCRLDSMSRKGLIEHVKGFGWRAAKEFREEIERLLKANMQGKFNGKSK